MGIQNLKSAILVLVYVAFFVLIPLEISAAVLTHGPVVGGVSAHEAKIFLRTDQAASVKIKYSTNPDLSNSLMTNVLKTSSTYDFTVIIPITALNPQTTYYLNIYVNGIPQLLLTRQLNSVTYAA